MCPSIYDGYSSGLDGGTWLEEKTGLESLVHARFKPPPSFPIQSQAAYLHETKTLTATDREHLPFFTFSTPRHRCANCTMSTSEAQTGNKRPREFSRPASFPSSMPPATASARQSHGPRHDQCMALRVCIWWIWWHTQEKFLGQPGMPIFAPPPSHPLHFTRAPPPPNEPFQITASPSHQ